MIRSKQRDGQSCLDDFRLSGACRALFPRPNGPRLDAVLLNTSGGITGGDTFDITATAQNNSALTLTTQAAERAYQSNDALPGSVRNTLGVGDNAALDWLPQETILFEGCNLRRRLRADLTATSRLLLVEPTVFGRTAMGETIRNGALDDRIEIRRDGRLLFADAIRLSGDIQSHLDRPAIAGRARAMATVILAAPDADTALDALRDHLPAPCGATLIRPGLVFARLLAEDSFALRQILIPALQHLRGRDLPRTWML